MISKSSPGKRELFLLICVLMMWKITESGCIGTNQSTCVASNFSNASCANYHWVNGTCVLNECPAETFWSNSTASCISCVEQLEDDCLSFCSQHGYFYSSHFVGCLKCSFAYGSRCTSCNSTNCLSCSAGYQVDRTGTSCVVGGCKAANCLSCSNSSFCLTCETGYMAVNGICSCQIDNCKLCSGSLCTVCNDGYQTDVTRTTCQPFCIQNCLKCSSYFFCTQCQPNYTYAPSTYTCQYNCSLIDANCATCASASFCSSCTTGYSLNLAGTQCVKSCTDSLCISCMFNPDVCSQCMSGWKVGPSGKCVQDVCSIANCLTCSGVNSCSSCASFYQLSLDSTSCLPFCSSTVPNCQSCSSATTCQHCASGYQLSNNTCTSSCNISNCLLCASKTTCMTCAPGTLMGFSSLTCNWNCGINGCMNCSSANTCSACYPGYTLSNDTTRCVIVCPQGYYANNGACAFCLGNYCQRCQASGQCIACRELFYLNHTDHNCYLCSKIDLFCYTCQPTAPVCTGCVEGFILKGNKCVLAGSTCSINNCAACDSSNSSSCLACRDGFTLSSNMTCERVKCPGEEFLVGSTCTCGQGAYSWNNKCLSCSTNCLTCTAQLCSSCAQGYYPTGKVCHSCSQNCQKCTSTACQTCKGGFMLQNGNCSARSIRSLASISAQGNLIVCQAGCDSCDISSNGTLICTAASNGYALVNQQLIKCDQSCKTCTGVAATSTNKNCLSCYTGFHFIGGNCKKCSDLKALTCSQFNSSLSLTCISGYTPVDGVCTACASHCLKCDISKAGSCDIGGCGKGFTQFGGSSLCIACFNGCATCGSDPNICISCLHSQVLLNGKCVSCPANCITCVSSSNCTACAAGYAPSKGQCRVPPGLPCVSYDTSLACTACDTNYKLTNGTCTVSSVCNITSSCTVCNYNQYLLNGNCFSCPALPNCSSCAMTDSSICFVCNEGYYLDSSNSCVNCATGCSDCYSATGCTEAIDGYYMVLTFSGFASGSVAPCAKSCLTCVSQASLCTSCPSGFTLLGSQCISAVYYEITIVGVLLGIGNSSNITSSMEKALFYQIFSLFVEELATILKFTSIAEFQQSSIIKSVTQGSLVTNFAINLGDVSSQAIDKLNTVKSVDVLSVTTTTNGQNNNGNDGNRGNGGGGNSTNLVLALAISLPIAFLIIIVIVIVAVKRTQTDEKGISDTEKNQVMEAGEI